jgi:hypothetical protein
MRRDPAEINLNLPSHSSVLVSDNAAFLSFQPKAALTFSNRK